MPLTKLVQIVAGAKVFMVIPVSAYSFPTAWHCRQIDLGYPAKQ